MQNKNWKQLAESAAAATLHSVQSRTYVRSKFFLFDRRDDKNSSGELTPSLLYSLVYPITAHRKIDFSSRIKSDNVIEAREYYSEFGKQTLFFLSVSKARTIFIAVISFFFWKLFYRSLIAISDITFGHKNAHLIVTRVCKWAEPVLLPCLSRSPH